jgi:hypothetical protein
MRPLGVFMYYLLSSVCLPFIIIELYNTDGLYMVSTKMNENPYFMLYDSNQNRWAQQKDNSQNFLHKDNN